MTQDMAQILVIRKLKYFTLIINQYLSYIIKLCLGNDNCATLFIILKKSKNLRKNQNFFFIKTIVHMLIKSDKI